MSPTPRRAHLKAPNHHRRRMFGMFAIIAIVLSAVAGFATGMIGFHPLQQERFEVVPRTPYTDTFEPIYLAEHGLPANSPKSNVPPATPVVRAIMVYPGHVELRAAGQILRTVGTGSKPINDFYQLMKLVNDPAWIEEPASGHLILKTALILKNVQMTIGSPAVSEVKMLDEPSVFIGATSGILSFVSVTITTQPTDAPGSDFYQPFVMVTKAGGLDASDSRFSNLGWDWNASYGVSWEAGSTGTVVNSSFTNNFIGAYTGESHGISFRHSTFSFNKLYGLDPHTFSSNLSIDDVVAEHNGAHGIIFSDNVTNSTITRSTSRFNGENGIMMDKSSTGNVIAGNTVANNTGDGLVTAASPNNMFERNTVTANRVGVRLDPNDAASTEIAANTVTFNGAPSENVTLDNSNISKENGGQPNGSALWWIWGVYGGMIVLVTVALVIWSPRQKRKHREIQQDRRILTSV